MGLCLGTANIIPGVSGGTFLLIFNIYERVFAILNRINQSLVLRLGAMTFTAAKNLGRKGSIRAILVYLQEMDFFFLGKLALGALAAILALSDVMKYLLVHHFPLTYSLFFGLILVSILIPVRMLKCLNGPVIVCVMLGIISTVAVSWLVNPYEKVNIKSALLERQYQQLHPDGNLMDKKIVQGRQDAGEKFTGKYTLEEYVYAGICGAVSISAMVLPGISGSLVLILMGAYFDVISAISGLKSGHPDALIFLLCFGVGIVAGGLLFVRLISFVLKHYYNTTMGFLIGLMAGSLHALWPFKHAVIMARQYVREGNDILMIENSRIYTNINILPENLHGLLFALVFFLVGCGVMFAFIRAESS
ncbi:MAG: DUF368 domain-containing protein [Proteobacteria bacterium]|nr:DUF368 domain-containing protein [Desulfobacula sp.]MBU4131379.1 DUF368 domain-containing protein [Pseudomonadota bacterium]